jgi:LacI family transcriptional regulator
MVRMKDIANDLGISVVTVLRALRNYPDVSAATRAEVLKRAKELNYRPNLAARALVTGQTGLMGLVIPNLVHASFAQLAVELSGVLRNQAFTLIISSTGEDGVDALWWPQPSPRRKHFVGSKQPKCPTSCWAAAFQA